MIGLSINPSTFDISYLRGDAHTITFDTTKPDGSVQDLTGWSAFKFTVKKSIDDSIGNAKFQKTLGVGITVPTPSNGKILVAIDSIDVEPLAGNHFYDLQAADAGSLVKTLRLARFIVPKDVTTPGSAGSPAVPVTPFPNAVSIDGLLYMKDATTGLYSALRINNGLLEVSNDQSATLPFNPSF